MKSFDHILVPIDDSELSDRTIDVALDLALRYDTDLIVVWVRKEALTLDQKKVAAALDDVEHETAAVIERIRPNLERAGFDLAKVRVEIRAGGVADAIVEACEESKPDLVVMGTHGRQGMKDHVLGSTTERVLARVNASVFAVRPIGYPFLRE